MEFMAIEVLRDTDHTYRHDLESFLYVLLWQCIRRGWEFVGHTLSKQGQLTGWSTGTFEDIARNKQGNMDRLAFEYILNEFPDKFKSIKPRCRELRSSLFPIKDDALFTGTPPQPMDLCGPIVKAFDNVISEQDLTELRRQVMKHKRQ
ncbi:serine/threonine-protein kinase Sgk2 [Trichoderma austrokoningii]